MLNFILSTLFGEPGEILNKQLTLQEHKKWLLLEEDSIENNFVCMNTNEGECVNIMVYICCFFLRVVVIT